MAKVAILGFGTVGSGVYEVIQENAKSISKRANQNIEVKYIVDIRDFAGEPFADKVISDFSIVQNDPEVNVIAEVIGGATIAYDYTKRALLAGKSVVTSNKELVATHGAELIKIAEEKGVNYLFEASVGGGIPIIRPMVRCLAANDAEEITGILNGTTNYILTKMIKDSVSFDDALKQAQEMGYAEKDPTADVEGIDAQRKIAILSSLAFGEHVFPNVVTAQGISKISLDDVADAGKLGYVIKLLGHAVNKDGNIYAYVAPHLINKDHMLSGVEDVFNAIMVKGNAVDEVMFYGRGAGKMPTASAVVADIIECVKHPDRHIAIKWGEGKKNIIAPVDTYESKYFVRYKGSNNDLNDIVKIKENISDGGVIVAITEKVSTADMEKKMAKLNELGEVLSYIRVL